MSGLLRAELFKQRSARTALWLGAALCGLVLVVVSLHGVGLSAARFGAAAEQRAMLFGWGEVLGALFAGLLGALAITGEFRHGTIRPTLIATPKRARVVVAKTGASMLIGAGFGLAAGLVAAAAGTATLRARGIAVRLDAGDFALVVLGGAAAAALWAAIGVGIGIVTRNQVPALVGIAVWLLFVENVLLGDIAGADTVARLLPGAAGKAIGGQSASGLLSPGLGLAVLILYALAATAVGIAAIDRRDIE